MAEVTVSCPHCGNETWEYEWDERQGKYLIRDRPIVYGITRLGTKVRMWNCCRGPV